MLTFPTKIIEPGSWQDRYYKFIKFLKNPWSYGKFKDINHKLHEQDAASRTSFYLLFPEEYSDKDRIILDSRNMPEINYDENNKPYFTVDYINYYIVDDKNKVRAYLTSIYKNDKPVDAKYMTWLKENGWFSVDCFEDVKTDGNKDQFFRKHKFIASIAALFNISKYSYYKSTNSNWGRYCTVYNENIWTRIKRTFKTACFNTSLKAIQFIYKILHTIDSCYLCIKYPFLYPRNRFTDKHYNNWRITKFAEDIIKKYSFYTDVVILTDKSDVPIFQVGSNKPEIISEEVPSEKYKRYNDTFYYIIYKDKRYNVALKPATYKNSYTLYPVLIGGEYVIYYPPKDTWYSLTNQEYKVYSFNNKTDDKEVRSYNVVIDPTMIIISKIIMFIHDYIIAPFFFIPTYTELDAMDDGWRRAFGMQMMDDLKKQLKSEKQLYEHRITQIKEKFGTLRYYVASASRETYDIISKYEGISATTCICCGKPARYITRGWICPYCEDCIGDDKDSATDLLNPSSEEDDDE